MNVKCLHAKTMVLALTTMVHTPVIVQPDGQDMTVKLVCLYVTHSQKRNYDPVSLFLLNVSFCKTLASLVFFYF